MKTDDLISALSADTVPRSPPPPRALMLATGAGLLLSLTLFLIVLGVRPDIRAAFLSWRFDVKLVLVGLALVLALFDCIRVARPQTKSAASFASLLVPTLLVAAIGAELASIPSAEWSRRLIGTNALYCLVWIPTLALAPLAIGLWAMRHGAPASPAVAGAAVGRLAAAAAAGLYALHCFDDSPLFIATWYTLATVIVTAAGAVIGSRLLKW
jgi:hypothetical protein